VGGVRVRHGSRVCRFPLRCGRTATDVHPGAAPDRRARRVRDDRDRRAVGLLCRRCVRSDPRTVTVRTSHRVAVLALTALVPTTTPGLASAAPPVPDPAQLPAGATPAPPEATEMRVLCAELPDAPDGPQIPRAQRILDFTSVWPI